MKISSPLFLAGVGLEPPAEHPHVPDVVVRTGSPVRSGRPSPEAPAQRFHFPRGQRSAQCHNAAAAAKVCRVDVALGQIIFM